MVVAGTNFQVEDFDAKRTANGDVLAVLDANRNALHQSALTEKVIHNESAQCALFRVLAPANESSSKILSSVATGWGRQWA